VDSVDPTTDPGPTSERVPASPAAPVTAAKPAPPTRPGRRVEGSPDRLLGRLNRRGFRLLYLADAGLLYAITVAIMLVRFGTRWPNYSVEQYLVSFTITVLVFVLGLYFGGSYEREPRLGSPPALPRIGRLMLVAGGAVALLNLSVTGLARELGFSTQRALPMPITNLITLIVVGSLVVTVHRRIAHLVRSRREGPPRVVLLGSAADLALADAHIDPDRDRAHIVARVSDGAALERAVIEGQATDVLILSRNLLDEVYPDPLTDLANRGVTVLHRVGPLETMYGLERIREVGGLPFVLLRNQWLPVSRRRFKRLFDLVLVVLFAPLWLPVLALVATYQLFAAGRPLLFRQVRVGVGGTTFEMVKFRTMSVGAEEDGRARLAEVGDHRILPACRWVRARRLDELPQLVNVIRGEMSLVGPRPERPELTAGFEAELPAYRQRNEVPPGITGLAQVNGRYHTDASYKLGYDLQYLANWSPLLDLEILLRTVLVLLRREA
jgi:lipopolysaccharide/colanic/teichoic acid biosynthesis glycosyltransferase